MFNSDETTSYYTIANGEVTQAFNGQAAPSELQQTITSLMSRHLSQANDVNAKIAALKDISTLEEMLREQKSQTRQAILDDQIQNMYTLLSTLTDPEAPEIGKKFVTALKKSAPKIAIDETINHPAYYRAFSFEKEDYGRCNRIHIKADRVENLPEITHSISHEEIHILQLEEAPALSHSPHNPETRTIIHPLDWIMAETIFERDAYAKEVFFNSLLAINDPSIRELSKNDIVTVAEFEAIRARSNNLQDALTQAAVVSLEKNKYRDNPNYSFADHYVDLSLTNYALSMKDRQKENQTGLKFIRLIPQDFWRIGNYGIGPNSLGAEQLDSRLLYRPQLTPENEAKLERLCKDHAIPDYENCMTLEEATSVPMRAINTEFTQTPAWQRQASYSNFVPDFSFAG